jgi:hypothetical protein
MPQVLQRSVSVRGPKFFHDGNVLMFVFWYDASTRDGPRPATNDDMLAYPDALRLADLPLDDPYPETEVNNPPPPAAEAELEAKKAKPR